MKAGAATDIGLQRAMNQDSYHCSRDFGAPYLYIVADGMGGHNGGEVASRIAVDTVKSFIENNFKDPQYINNRLVMIRDAIIEANSVIYNLAMVDMGLRGMGTTLTMAMIEDKKVYIGHIGDSRMYLMRNGKCRKLTEDHSLVAQLIKNGSISPEEGNCHPQKNIITKALGVDMELDMELNTENLWEGDTLLLCTDGLTNMLNLKEIVGICSIDEEPRIITKMLVDEANMKGGRDNITAIVVKVRWSS